MRKNINKVTKNVGRIGKCSQITDPSVDLSVKKGTVSNVFSKNIDKINKICETDPLPIAKLKIIEILKEAKDCPSKSRIIYNINTQPNNKSLTFYLWDMFLKGSGNGVI